MSTKLPCCGWVRIGQRVGPPHGPVHHGQGVHGIDDVVARDQPEPNLVGVTDCRDERHGELLLHESCEEVGSVVLLGLTGRGVADDDTGSVDRGCESGLHGAAHQHLRLELRGFVVVEEPLSEIELVLGELAVEVAADVAGAHVLQASELGSGEAELDHVGGALDVDAAGNLLGDGEVVHGCQVPDLRHRLEPGSIHVVDPQSGRGDVALDQGDPTSGVRMRSLDLRDALGRHGHVVRLHEADRVHAFAPREDPRQQRRSQEPGETRHQQRTHTNRLQPF